MTDTRHPPSWRLAGSVPGFWWLLGTSPGVPHHAESSPRCLPALSGRWREVRGQLPALRGARLSDLAGSVTGEPVACNCWPCPFSTFPEKEPHVTCQASGDGLARESRRMGNDFLASRVSQRATQCVKGFILVKPAWRTHKERR